MAELTTSLIPALGHALLHFLWQGVVIGLIAASALIALRRARPQVRYAVACVALAACALAPTITVLAQLGADVTVTIVSVHTSFTAALAASLQGAADRVGSPVQMDVILPWVVALWAIGASLLSLRIAGGMFWIQRLRGTPPAAFQGSLQSRLDALAARVGVQRAVALRVVDVLDTPASAGWWHPVVVIPTAVIVRMPAELVDALLAHELAHIRRHDYLVNLLQHIVEALLFYHPVVWWLSRQIRDERELIADHIAVRATGKPRELALALAELAELRRADAVRLQLAQPATGGRLLRRIQRLLKPDTAVGTGPLILALVSFAAACVAVHAQPQRMPRATLEHIVHEEAQVESAQPDAIVESEASADALASIDADTLAADVAAMNIDVELTAAERDAMAADAATSAADAEVLAADAATSAADAEVLAADAATRVADAEVLAADAATMAADAATMAADADAMAADAAAAAAEIASAEAAGAAEVAADAAIAAAEATQATKAAVQSATAAATEAAAAAATHAAAQSASQAAAQAATQARARAEADAGRGPTNPTNSTRSADEED